jgi:hypothetical protein
MKQVCYVLDGNAITELMTNMSVISGFRRDVDDICALLGYYAASSGNPLPTFRDKVSIPPSRLKKYNEVASLDFVTLEDGMSMCPETFGEGLSFDAA